MHCKSIDWFLYETNVGHLWFKSQRKNFFSHNIKSLTSTLPKNKNYLWSFLINSLYKFQSFFVNLPKIIKISLFSGRLTTKKSKNICQLYLSKKLYYGILYKETDITWKQYLILTLTLSDKTHIVTIIFFITRIISTTIDDMFIRVDFITIKTVRLVNTPLGQFTIIKHGKTAIIFICKWAGVTWTWFQIKSFDTVVFAVTFSVNHNSLFRLVIFHYLHLELMRITISSLDNFVSSLRQKKKKDYVQTFYRHFFVSGNVPSKYNEKKKLKPKQYEKSGQS